MTVTNVVETTMIWGTVSGASMVGMVISLLLSVGLPIFLCIFIYKKTKAWVPAFFLGCGNFGGFVLILDLSYYRADGDRKRDPGQYLAVCDLRWACSSTF